MTIAVTRHLIIRRSVEMVNEKTLCTLVKMMTILDDPLHLLVRLFSMQLARLKPFIVERCK